MIADDEPRKPKPIDPAKAMETMSIDELTDLIASLKEQISLAEATINRKKAATNAAAAFFKS